MAVMNFFFFVHLPFPNLVFTPSGTYNPNDRGSDAFRGATVFGPEH